MKELHISKIFMNKKRLLYFKKINLDKSNYQKLISYFQITSVKDFDQALKISKNIKNQVQIIYCDQRYYYSSIFLSKFKSLKVLVSSTTSTNFIDKKYCKLKNIKIISLENEKKFLTQITPTAEHVFGLILILIRNYIGAIKSVNLGKFDRRPFGGYKMLSRSTLGIIGFGRLGKLIKKIALGFKMNVITVDKNDKKYFAKKLKKVLDNSDIVTLNIPEKDNSNFFSNKIIKNFKNNFYLINTSRGEVVDEKFIIKLLKKKVLLVYGTDVLMNEFKKDFDIKKNIILKNKKRFNIVITPHIGGSTKDAWKLTENRVIERLIMEIK